MCSLFFSVIFFQIMHRTSEQNIQIFMKVKIKIFSDFNNYECIHNQDTLHQEQRYNHHTSLVEFVYILEFYLAYIFRFVAKSLCLLRQSHSLYRTVDNPDLQL